MIRRLAVGAVVAGLMTAGSAQFHFAGVPTLSAAGPLMVVAVPWAGSETADHEVFSGGSVTLQAVASMGGDGNAVALNSGTWDPGDGTGPQVIVVANSRALELKHTYVGADNTPFLATISVTQGATTVTDTFRVRIKPKSLGLEVNMAIDKALWYSHKTMQLGTSGAFTTGFWTAGDSNANTGSAVQGFEINGHRETGDPTKDPYVDDVGRGLRYLQAHLVREVITPTSETNYVVSGSLGSAVAVDQATGVCGITPVTDTLAPGLTISRNCNGALNNAGGDTIRWADGSCAAPTSGFFSNHSALLQNVVRNKPGNVPGALPGSTECLVDQTASRAWDVTFGSPWGVNPSGEFHYTRREWSSVAAVTTTFNPDTNGNGFGDTVDTFEQVYIGGQVIDAFVASGTMTAAAVVGPEAGRTYKDIVQDMQDSYSFGQNDDVGGWVYRWNDNSGIDSSSTGWWAVGTLAGTLWGNATPSFVTSHNFDRGVKKTLQFYDGTNTGNDGSCGYRSMVGNVAETGSCLLQMNADAVPPADPRWVASEKWIARQWPNGDSRNSLYSMYNVTKAMRTAIGGSKTLLDGTIDWYAADANPAVPMDPGNGYARILVGTAQSDGQLAQNGTGTNTDGWTSGTLAHAWGVLILSTALFEQGPTAACSVDSSTVCKAGSPSPCNPGNADPYATVHFDGSASTPGDNPIASYAWDFKNGPPVPDATTVMTQTSFTQTGTFNVSLTVTDTKGHASVVTCPVVVTDQALPPVADAGGPYSVCQGQTSGAVLLNGAGSFGRGSNIVLYEWDLNAPINFTPADVSGPTPNGGDQTAFFAAKGVGTYDIGLRVTDDTPAGSGGPLTATSFTTVQVKAANDPSCTQNTAPVCSSATPSYPPVFPLNSSRMLPVTVNGVTDADGDPISINVTAICQDEVTNDGVASYSIDGSGLGSATAQVRDERGGTRTSPGNGRVYHIYFTASDGRGGSCSNQVMVGVPIAQGGTALDGPGALQDSTKAAPTACPAVGPAAIR